MKALVLGRGASGKGAGALLASRGVEVDYVEGYDMVVASPGLRTGSELQLGCEELRRRGVKMLAVTGSKGKSSVVKLVADATGGVPCGNYGTSVCEVASSPWPAGKSKWAVVEVSSFQLETTSLAPDTFEAAAVLNLQEDHLDRHGSAAAYHVLKLKLLSFAKRGVRAWDIAPGELASAGALMAGSYFDNDVLRANGAAAAALMRAAGLGDAEISRAFASFVPLPHRMERVGEFGGVVCIDDSKATSIAALRAGVRMAGRPVRLVAGGLAKGDDPFAAIADLTATVKKVYLIGQCADAFAKAWRGAVDCEICGTMEKAVSDAMREAAKGEALLLSPGAASFDQFANFGERGEVFAALARKEGQKR